MGKRRIFGHELMRKEKRRDNIGIPTFCQALDVLLGDGIKPGMVTEVVGLPGVGKSTFCLQLCLAVQIPKHLRGHDSEAIFINTDNSLSAKRLAEMSSEFVSHCNKITANRKPAPGPLLSPDEVMSKIHIAQCCDIDELVQIIMNLETFLEGNNVKLVVIDSIAFPMYTEEEDFSTRVKVLYGIAQLLYGIANKFNVAVVLTNNMTTRFGDEREGGVEYFVPFLGDAWSHVPNQRIQFSLTKKIEENDSRQAQVLKSNYCPLGSCNYRILSSGFRD